MRRRMTKKRRRRIRYARTSSSSSSSYDVVAGHRGPTQVPPTDKRLVHTSMLAKCNAARAGGCAAGLRAGLRCYCSASPAKVARQHLGPWKGHKFDVLEGIINAGAPSSALYEYLHENSISRLEHYVRSGDDDAAFGISEAGVIRLASAMQNSSDSDQELLLYGALGVAGAHAVGDALLRCSSLRRLAIFDTRIGPEGTAALARALAVNTGLSSLELSCEANARLEPLALDAPSCPETRTARPRASDNDMRPEGLTALAEALRSNTGLGLLDLSGNVLCDLWQRRDGSRDG
eukprot:3967213-Prymnesium_polylepis.1